jgi:hypothetical protein
VQCEVLRAGRGLQENERINIMYFKKIMYVHRIAANNTGK